MTPIFLSFYKVFHTPDFTITEKKSQIRHSPKSFRLPTGGPSGEYQTLYNNYNSYDALTDTAGPHFVLGGRTEPGSSPLNQGTVGYYWSSSAYIDMNPTSVYRLFIDSTNGAVSPALDYGYKRNGFPLRCLAQ